MKFGPQHVKDVVRKFVCSWRAELWPFVAAEVRNALVDSMLVENLVAAHVFAPDLPLTSRELIKFRFDIVSELDKQKFRIHP